MGTVTHNESISANLSSYDSTNHSYASINSNYPVTNGYSGSTSTNYAQFNWKTGSGAQTYVYYYFNLPAIPSNATINSVTAKAKGYINTTSSSRVTTRQMQLCTGTTLKGTALTLSTSTNAQTFSSPGTWTATELASAGVRFFIQRGTSNVSSNYTLRVYGADITVDYTWQETTYTITVNNSTSTAIVVDDTEPSAGSDVLVRADNISGIMIKDNNTNVTSQFTQQSMTTAPYTIETRGSYGFTLNANNYYESQNKGVDKSAAVCRISFDLIAAATITFTYINYAESGYDFGVFGNVDVALNTDYYPANSSVDETSYKLACNTSTYNKSTEQTLTYSNIAAGEHYIDVKFSKDDGTSSNNDTLQFKITITYNTPQIFYGYTITNISEDHVIVVSTATGPKIYLKINGSWVQYSKVYQKTNGSWVEVSNLDTFFNTNANYVKG